MAEGWTAYTHQSGWTGAAADPARFMVSVETATDAVEAWAGEVVIEKHTTTPAPLLKLEWPGRGEIILDIGKFSIMVTDFKWRGMKGTTSSVPHVVRLGPVAALCGAIFGIFGTSLAASEVRLQWPIVFAGGEHNPH
jgi:hypothetical protein